MVVSLCETNIKIQDDRVYAYKLDHNLLLPLSGVCGKILYSNQPLKTGRKLHQALSDYSSARWYNSIHDFVRAL